MLWMTTLFACTQPPTSVEWESCARTPDCSDGLRCIEQTCRTQPDADQRIAELSTPLPSVPSTRGIYTINQTEEGEDHTVELLTLTLGEDETIARFRTTGTSKGRRVKVYPPGHRQAFRLMDARTREVYHMLDVEGIAIAPDWSRYSRSKPLEFTVVLDRIPDGVDRLHLVEGEMEINSMLPWTFLNIRLSAENRYLEEADLPSETASVEL